MPLLLSCALIDTKKGEVLMKKLRNFRIPTIPSLRDSVPFLGNLCFRWKTAKFLFLPLVHPVLGR